MAALAITVVGKQTLIEPENVDVAATASTGDSFPNDGHTILFIKNAHSAAVTLTIDRIPNETYTITNAKSYVLGPFPQADYNDRTGHVRFSFDVVTAITVAALRVL